MPSFIKSLPIIPKIASIVGIISGLLTSIWLIIKIASFLKRKFSTPLQLGVSASFLPTKGNTLSDTYYLVLTVAHTGGAPIALQAVGFDLPNNDAVIPSKTSLPTTLKAGDPEHAEYISVLGIGKKINKLDTDVRSRGWVKDSQGNKHPVKISKGIQKNMRDFLVQEGIIQQYEKSFWGRLKSWFNS